MLAMWTRYTAVAPGYDLLSAEWPVYRVGRRLAVPLLHLRAGDTVVDVGCGTGLNFPLLAAAVGPGHIVGVDSSAQMLAMAQRRVRRLERTSNCHFHLHRADARAINRLRTDESALRCGADAVIFTYSLSLMRPWREAWEQALALTRPGTRIAVVDMATPTGPSRLLTPLARLATSLGGSDIKAHPWQALAAHCVDITHRDAWGGHVQVWVGTVPAGYLPSEAHCTPPTTARMTSP